MHNDPLIKLEDADIPIVDKYKFLAYIWQEVNIHPTHKISKKQIHLSPTTSVSGRLHRIGS